MPDRNGFAVALNGRATLLALVAWIVPATSLQAVDSRVEALAALMAGEYQIRNEDVIMTDRRTRIDAPALGDVVFYLEVRLGEALDVYRQRLLVLEGEGDEIIQRAYSLVEPGRWAGAGADDFQGVGRDVVAPTLPEGCEQRWTKTDRGFRGYTDPARCVIVSSRTGKPRRIEAESLLSASGLSQAERGFDEDGRQLFGTEPGGAYWLARQP